MLFYDGCSDVLLELEALDAIVLDERSESRRRYRALLIPRTMPPIQSRLL